MFKIITLILLAITSSGLAQPLVEAKAGYFFFTDSKLRKVYDRGGLDLQLSASYPIWDLTCNWTLNAYGAVEYFHRTGKSLNAHQKTSIWSLPVNLGLKPIYTVNEELQYYFAIGPRYFYIHQHNTSPFVPKNRSRNGLGLFLNSGFNYFFCNQFLLDLFAEYSYAKVHFHSTSHTYTRSTQVGGLTFGGALGYEF